MSKICAISDTHNCHEAIEVPECDILIHAGDFSSMGRFDEVAGFLYWFDKQHAKHKIFISGNHDFMDQEEPTLFKGLVAEYPGITYLRDEGCEVEGIKIWGRPWTPQFYDWAFMKERGSAAMRSTLSVIPEGIDILLTHGPAHNILCKTVRGDLTGCEDLLSELERIQPKAMIFGHIHEAKGVKQVNNTTHINVASLDEHYQVRKKPVTRITYSKGIFKVKA